MISYVKQVSLCSGVRKAIERSLAESGDANVRAKIGKIPPVDSILRVVSLYPNLDTEEGLRAFMVQHIFSELRLSKDEQDQIKRNNGAVGEQSSL